MRDRSTRMPPAFAAIHVIVLSLFFANPSRSQQPVPQAPDTLAQRDSVAVIRMPPYSGSIDRNLDSSSFLESHHLNWMDQRYLGDILQTFPGVYIRDQGSVGQYNQVNIRGVDWRSVALLMNGRTMNDPASGVLHLFYVAPEYIDRLEFIPGPRAFLYGFGSAGGTINIVPKHYWSSRPLTKIDYSQGAYNEYHVDGTYAQNILRNMNFMFGFLYQGTDGRYTNTGSGTWNARAQLRYAPLGNVTVIFSEYFTSTNTNMNGGLDYPSRLTLNPFNPPLATVRNSDSYEKVTRHDLDLSLIGTFLGDTVDATTLSLYYTHDLREYRDEENRERPNGVLLMSDHTSSWSGLNLLQHISWGFQRVSFGGTWELRQIEGSPNLGRRRNSVAAVWAKDEARIGNLLTLAAYGRYETFLGRQSLGYGADLRLPLGRGISLYGGASRSRRQPNYAELFWSDSTVFRTPEIRAEQHTDLEIGGELFFGEENAVALSFFQRRVADPIDYSLAHTLYGGRLGYEVGNGPTSTGQGLELRLALRIWVLQLEGAGMWLRFAEDGIRQKELYPELAGHGGFFYRNVLLEGALDLKAGFQARFSTSSRGAMFDQAAVAYVPNGGTVIERGAALDFYAIAQMGNAYVHFIWENLTDAGYFSTPYYPARDRNIRFGISWKFLD
jgi:outer membrane cobalamin receptor